MTRLWLASRSPRRRALLRGAGIPFEVVDVEVDETPPPGLEPEAVARELALRKARAGAGRAGQGWVLGADTLVVLGDRILGKPRDRRDASSMLAALSARPHRVVTGVALVGPGGAEFSGYDVTHVVMRPMSPGEIRAYVDSGESDDKAGAYAIQEAGDRFVERLDGSWSNVVGLPMELLRDLLARTGDGW